MDWSLLYLTSEWVIRLALLPVVARRHEPTAATAWLLVIFFQPWVGLAIYWLVGSKRVPRKRIRQHVARVTETQRLGHVARQLLHRVQPELGPKMVPLVTLAEELGEMPILGHNRADLMTDAQAFFDSLVADIDTARDHVHLMFYIFAADAVGRRIADALYRAVQRGVICRVLADWVGSRRMLKTLGREMQRHGVAVHAMLPIGFFRRRVARIDMRNHRKLAVIDGRIAYTGSQNLVDPHYGHKDLVWRDIMVRLVGPVVHQLQHVFLEDWYAETDELLEGEHLFPPPDTSGRAVIQTLPSGPVYETANYQRLVVAALYAAEQRVIITSPYLVPDQALLQAIEVAAHRNVDVSLVVPRRSDQRLVAAVGRAYFDDLLKIGARLYLYNDGLLHTKSMTVDDTLALLGSGNFDIRSFYLNFELNLLAYGPEVTAALRSIQQGYIASSKPLTLQEWQRRPLVYSTLDSVAKLFSPLM